MRTGLTFLIKQKVEEQYSLLRVRNYVDGICPESLLGYDCETYTRVLNVLGKRALNVVILGSRSVLGHLPIFSFLIRCGKRFLHYNYVCALLNDVFGIQSRGGCQCSGPYSQRLLGLTQATPDGSEVPNERNEQIEHALVHYKERAEVLRPGYTRLSLPFKGIRDEEVEYVLKALEWIAKNGWALMCQYRCNHRTGEVSVSLYCWF
jgi:selenocysteine lyase/cysteine desulfurase